MHTHTLLYKILVEDVLGEAKTPSISDDFKSQWPKVLNAIHYVQRTGQDQELFISGKSHKYENYKSGGDVKIKITVKKHRGEKYQAVYSSPDSHPLGKPFKHGIIKVVRFINPDAIFRDYYNRVLQARGNVAKVSALKKGLMNKLKRYGAPAEWLESTQKYVDSLVGKSGSSANFADRIIRSLNGHNLNNVINSLDKKLEQDGKLASGEIKILTKPGISDLQYKAMFFHELTHAFDPKSNLPHRVRDKDHGPGADFYLIDPVELDASLNEFSVIADEFPDEFNTAVKDMIKRGRVEIELNSLISRYKGRVDKEKFMLYQEELLSIYARIKKTMPHRRRSSPPTAQDSNYKTHNKFLQKLINILDDPKEAINRSLQDRLSSYKDTKKRDESHSLRDSPAIAAPAIAAPAIASPAIAAPAIAAPATPMNNATPGVMDDSLLQEVLRETFGLTNGAYNFGRMAYGDQRITPQNKSFKGYPEVLAMCKNIIQRGVAGLSAAEANRAVYLVAIVIIAKSISLEFDLSKLMNSATKIRIDDGLFARFLKVAIEMEF